MGPLTFVRRLVIQLHDELCRRTRLATNVGIKLHPQMQPGEVCEKVAGGRSSAKITGW